MSGDRQAPRCWKLECWPAADRASWEHNTTPGDPFDDPRWGASLRPATRQKICVGYGRWLDFLATNGWLDPEQPALQRVTRRRLRAYVQALKAARNADYTIIGRISELAMAMRILAPDADVGWIRRPDGISIYALLPKTKRTIIVPDARVLFRWGLKMMDAQLAAAAQGNPIAFRDGLLIAMLAARGRRLRSMTELRVRCEMLRQEVAYRIQLGPDQTKTHVHDRFDLPEVLTPYVRHYLANVRPALLAGRQEDALWISARGGPLTAKGIENRILKLSRVRFGVAFGPHRFRHAIATSSVLRDPASPGLAAGVLGGSAQVIEQHYNRAGQIHAARKYAEMLERRRKELGGGSSGRPPEGP